MLTQKEMIPLYSRVATSIQNKIISGQYGPGDRLPTEDQLVLQYDVSKITVRKALSLLESDSLIIRTRGKGTFVTDRVPKMRQVVHTRLNKILHAISKSPIKTLEIKTVKISESRIPKIIRTFFNKTNTEEISRVRRVITQNKIESFFENYLPTDIARHLTLEELNEKKSIQAILESRMGLKVTRGEMYLQALPADEEISQLLNCWTFEPLIQLQAFFWSEPDRPFEIVNHFIRASNFKYKMDIEIS
jgi:GntR family transcriptional regulator